MDLNELIESTLRSQHLEEMQNRPREEYSPIKGMSSEQIERYACFLYKELQARVEQLERMNVRLDEIMDELKKSGKKIDNLTGLLEKANDRADKALLESKMHQKENIELKKMNATLQQRLNLMNSMAFGPSKSQKGIEKKKPVRGIRRHVPIPCPCRRAGGAASGGKSSKGVKGTSREKGDGLQQIRCRHSDNP